MTRGQRVVQRTAAVFGVLTAALGSVNLALLYWLHPDATTRRLALDHTREYADDLGAIGFGLLAWFVSRALLKPDRNESRPDVTLHRPSRSG